MITLPKVFCLLGPTAVGKTDVAVNWVQQYPLEIISVDSALIYKDMDIGTAKPDANTLAKAPHRLINFLDPAQSYSAANFYQDAVREIEDIIQLGKIPLLVGGTMLYFRALQQGLNAMPEADSALRQKIDALIAEQGLATVYQQLQNVDPVSAQKIKPNDRQRIQRALEVYQLTGKPLSEFHQQQTQRLPYEFVNLAIVPEDRVGLHQRIEQRFQNMLTAGVIEEVAALKQREDLHLGLPSMRAVGYRQIWQYLDGEYSKEEMIAKAVAATRQLAKRQITWLRRWPNIKKYRTANDLLMEKFSINL